LKSLEKISAFVSKNMALFAVATAIFALILPDAFKWTAPRISILLGVIMFGMGMTLSLQEFKEIFKRPFDVFIGLVAQFTIMPILAFSLATIFNLPPEIAVGVILVGTCPGGTASNVITFLAKGDLALSVSISMASTILAPIVTPLLTWLLAGAWVDVSFVDMMLSILQMVVAPIVLGVVVNHFFSDFVSKIVKLLPFVSIVAILLIIGGVVSVNATHILETGALVMIVVVLHNLFGYTFGYVTARLFGMNVAKKKAVAIEIGMQNSGLAVSLAMAHFGAAAAIPGALFSVWHNISGSIVANFLAQKSNKDS